MFLLDSDHLSILWYNEGIEYDALLKRINSHAEEAFAVSIVTFDEQLRGWQAYVKKSSRRDGTVKGYAELHRLLDRFSESQVIDVDDTAADKFIELRSQGVRIGSMDLRIASIAIINDFTLLTRNTIDFERVPSLRFEDWTQV